MLKATNMLGDKLPIVNKVYNWSRHSSQCDAHSGSETHQSWHCNSQPVLVSVFILTQLRLVQLHEKASGDVVVCLVPTKPPLLRTSILFCYTVAEYFPLVEYIILVQTFFTSRKLQIDGLGKAEEPEKVLGSGGGSDHLRISFVNSQAREQDQFVALYCESMLSKPLKGMYQAISWRQAKQAYRLKNRIYKVNNSSSELVIKEILFEEVDMFQQPIVGSMDNPYCGIGLKSMLVV